MIRLDEAKHMINTDEEGNIILDYNGDEMLKIKKDGEIVLDKIHSFKDIKTAYKLREMIKILERGMSYQQ